MRILFTSIFAVGVLSLAGCSSQPEESRAIADAEALKTFLSENAAQGKIVYAHQDDLVYGHDWKVEDVEGDSLNRSDVKSVVGSFPFMVGFDLGGIELENENNLDGVPFALMRRAAVLHSKRGGIVTFSWHSRNPLTGGDAWDVSSNEVVESILPDGHRNGLYMLWLKRCADFLSTLRDEGGRLIPVVFRPYHENIGSWFWWGGNLCTAAQYKALFKMTYDYLVGERGLDNLVWAYSPNSNSGIEAFEERYPGDDIIDIVGVDHYVYKPAPSKNMTEEDVMTAANQTYVEILRKDLEMLSSFSASHGKIMALTETGFESLPYPTWWTEVLLPVLKDYPVSYVLTWRNACDKPEHYYAPFPGEPNAGDFVSFARDAATLFL